LIVGSELGPERRRGERETISRITSIDDDVVTVGGGVAGASRAAHMAEAGFSVFVLERETVFRDRVRGE